MGLRFGRLGTGLLALLCLAALLPATAAAAGSISGTVTDASTGAPIKGLQVCAYSAPEGQIGAICGTTDASGAYAIAAGPMSYYVVFEGNPLGYGNQWYDQKNYATRDTVAVGSDPVSGIDAELLPFARIEGTVREEGSGTPVGDTRVCAWSTTSGEQGHCTRSEADGTYVIDGIPSGEYLIEFWPSTNHLWQWYDHKEEHEEADPVTVDLGDVLTGVDADLSPAAGLEGTMRRASTGQPFLEAWVEVWPVGEDEFWLAGVEGDGSFSIVGLPPGDYKVEFLPQIPRWKTQFWDRASTWDEATTLSLSAGTVTTGIEAWMEPVPRTVSPSPSSIDSSLAASLPVPSPLSPSALPLVSRKTPRACPKGLRKKRLAGKARCVSKHKRRHRRHQSKAR